MIKAFCDWCEAELGLVESIQQNAKDRGHHINVTEGDVAVQVHVVPQSDKRHICRSCAYTKLAQAWGQYRRTQEEGTSEREAPESEDDESVQTSREAP